MKRRSFLTLLAGVLSAPAIVPSLCATLEVQAPSSALPEGKNARLRHRSVLHVTLWEPEMEAGETLWSREVLTKDYSRSVYRRVV